MRFIITLSFYREDNEPRERALWEELIIIIFVVLANYYSEFAVLFDLILNHISSARLSVNSCISYLDILAYEILKNN